MKYTEYKKAQALWLQREKIRRESEKGVNLEQMCIEYYLQYLSIMGKVNPEIAVKIKEYYNAIGTYHIEVNDEFFNLGYDEKIVSNIDKLMDALI
jgi:hypothetical protein